MKKVIVLLGALLLATLMLSGIGDVTAIPSTKAGGEILHESKEGALYNCGPDYEDICWDDGSSATKIYFAQEPDYDYFTYLPLVGWFPLYECSLWADTTDALEEANTPNDDSAHAAALSNYSGLALATGDKGDTVPAKDDWFRLDNAKIGSTYEVVAAPDKTTNYNLGIIVYDTNLVPIILDVDPADNHYAKIELTAEHVGPYFFKVHQITTACSGEGYYLQVTIEEEK